MIVGHVDVSMQSHVQGWASDGDQPAAATIVLNGEPVARVMPTINRPDVAAQGHPLVSGWEYYHATPLDVTDVLQVLGDDGRPFHPGPMADHAARMRELLHGLDPSMTGLEFGALDRPVLGKARWKVDYVDHATREDLLAKYDGDRSGQLSRERVVETDVVWTRGGLAASVPEGRTYDFALASHVIEHVPDAIGWLLEICSVLVTHGRINLAIPDRDSTFDRFRRTTSAEEMIDDYVRRLDRPSARQIFDHVCNVSPDGVRPGYNPAAAIQAVREAEASGAYVDVHARVFTASSFVETLRTIVDAGLLPLGLDAIFRSRRGTNEFIVSLRKRDDLPAGQIAASW